MKNATSKKDFIYFQERCKYWQKELGLMNWEIEYKHLHEDGIIAVTSYDCRAAKVCITLSTKWRGMEVTEYQLNRSALHEMLHVVLAPLMIETEAFLANNYIDGIEHKIIQTICNLQLKL